MSWRCDSRSLSEPDRIGALPGERHAALRRQGSGQHEPAERGVDQAGRGRHPERQARIEAAQQAADRRAQNEAQAKAHADDAERLGALVGRGDVGDVGEGGGDGGRGDAGDEAADQQQRERRRDRHEDVVEPHAQAGDQDDRPAAVAVGQRAQKRRAEELHQAPGRGEHAEHLGGTRGVAVHEAEHDGRQDREHDPQRQAVERHRAEDEGQRTPGVHGDVVDGWGGNWSGRQDLNLRPPVPQTDALPGCATPRPVPRGPRGKGALARMAAMPQAGLHGAAAGPIQAP